MRIRYRPLIARFWHLSRLHYRLRGHRIEGRPGDAVWYFAFGSNMHDSAFLQRRRMRPSEWRCGCLKGYRLRFNLDGRPIGRAAPANIETDAEGEVWGVLYRITRRELLRLDSTEGIPGGRYRHTAVSVEDSTGERIAAVTYVAAGNPQDGTPSLRYMTLLREGARAHGLPEHYIRYLDGVRNHPE
jgi:gamma-glutamylcyclotransferase